MPTGDAEVQYGGPGTPQACGQVWPHTTWLCFNKAGVRTGMPSQPNDDAAAWQINR